MNTGNLWSGSTDTPLTEHGHEQAKLAGKFAQEQGFQFDLIISSPLRRAHHTAQHVADSINYPHQNILLHEGLKERDFGSLEGKKYAPYTAKYLLGEHHLDVHEGVEALADLQKRMDAFHEYLRTLPHDTILVAAHGASGRALYRSVKGLPITHRNTRFKNAEIHKFL
jgi:2,3-bisphosphoglycerate-dependent phosphoglycerate mutase